MTYDLPKAERGVSKRPLLASTGSHSPVPGDRVKLLAPLALNALPKAEPAAILVGPITGVPNLWRVRFEGDLTGRTHLRFVHTSLLSNTPGIIAALTDHFRANIDPALLFEPPVFQPREDIASRTHTRIG